MKCTNCGNVNSNNSIFCTECGQSLSSNSTGGYNVSDELNKIYNYFNQRADLYDSLFRLNSVVNCTPAKYSVVKIIICSYFLSSSIPGISLILRYFISIVSGDCGSIYEVFVNILVILFIATIIFIPALILGLHIKKVRTSRKIIENAKTQVSVVGKELYDYYISYGYCPVSFENSQPEVLYKLCEIVQCGRAFTIDDALRVYNEDCYRIGLNNSQNDIILNSVYCMYNH